MKKRLKGLLSVWLAVLFTVGLLPMPIMAADDHDGHKHEIAYSIGESASDYGLTAPQNSRGAAGQGYTDSITLSQEMDGKYYKVDDQLYLFYCWSVETGGVQGYFIDGGENDISTDDGIQTSIEAYDKTI